MKAFISASLALLLLSGCSESDEKLACKAEKIHNDILTVDTHCDTPMRLAESDFDLGVKHDDGCVDFPRMAEGGLDAEFFAVYISQGPRNDSAYSYVHKQAVEIFEAIHRNVVKNSSMAELAYSPMDAYRLKKKRKIAVFIGIENGYVIGNDLTGIKEFYDLGARYITLCHTGNNDICDSSMDPKGPEHNGLSEFGKEVVKEMNRLGIMIDVSHISDEAFFDVISFSEVPVIASHSSSRALCSSPRNLSDEMLLSLKSNGGVIQICFFTSYIRTPEPNPELDKKYLPGMEISALFQMCRDSLTIMKEGRSRIHTRSLQLLRMLSIISIMLSRSSVLIMSA
jgi:membrane dipeptidase